MQYPFVIFTNVKYPMYALSQYTHYFPRNVKHLYEDVSGHSNLRDLRPQLLGAIPVSFNDVRRRHV
jgi:hypothetical protein